jgi:hypothetical protein
MALRRNAPMVQAHPNVSNACHISKLCGLSLGFEEGRNHHSDALDANIHNLLAAYSVKIAYPCGFQADTSRNLQSNPENWSTRRT